MDSYNNKEAKWYVKLSQSLLPYEQMIYTTHLTKEEVLDRLQRAIEPYRLFRIWPSDGEKPYQGYVKGSKFSALRIMYYRNSYQPRVTGSVVQQQGNTCIRVSMRLRYYTLGFTAVIMFFVGLLALVSNFNGAPIFILLFVYGLTLLGFKYESAKSRRFFAALFEAGVQRLL